MPFDNFTPPLAMNAGDIEIGQRMNRWLPINKMI
jgi:hypothetical protein